jgi:hypothetical protein
MIKVRFFSEPEQDEIETKKQGRPIYKETEMVEVTFAGDRSQVLIRLADDPVDNKGTGAYKDIYAAEYDAFKSGKARAVSGTPLEHWPILTTAQVAEMKALNIFSVEDLAGLQDRALRQIGPNGRDLHEQAKSFLKLAKESAPMSEMAAEIARLKAQIDAMNAINAPQQEEEARSIDVDDATEDQLKQFIKERTGEAPRGNVSRDTLVQRVTSLLAPETV